VTVRPRTVTAIVIALNEEGNIGACLDALGWADELIVVDARSTDATAAIARERGATVIAEEWAGYGHARDLAAAAASGEWILAVDADERVPEALAKEIRGIVSGEEPPAAPVYAVARRAFFLGRWIRHCGWYPGYVPRLFRNGEARYNEARVHEGLVFAGTAARLRNPLDHYTDDNLFHYLQKFDRYTTLAAEDLRTQGRVFTTADLLLRPASVFLKMYVLRLGFLDGLHGLVLSLLSSAYVFVKYAKLREPAAAPPAR
jgi:glycosyltransferase involved in cell wall biosynthesis